MGEEATGDDAQESAPVMAVSGEADGRAIAGEEEAGEEGRAGGGGVIGGGEGESLG